MRSIRTLTHEKARRYLQAAADRQLNPTIQPALERHLAGCPKCQHYAEQLAMLEARLENELPAAWPTQSVAETQVASTVEKIHHHTRRISMKNILSSTARTLAFGLGIIVLIAGLAWGIRNLRPGVEATQSVQGPADTPVVTDQETEQFSQVTPLPPPTEQLPTPVTDGATGLFPTTSFNFPDGFPSAPATFNLYRLQLPEAVTAENVRQMATRLGVTGGVYSQAGEGFDQVYYEVTDGFKLMRFINFAEQFVYETGYTDPLYSDRVPLSYNEQLQIATDYLNSFGLLDQPYQTEPSAIEQGVVRFTPLLDGHRVIYGNGQNPGNMEWISVQVNPAGQVSRVMYSQKTFSLIGEYPILTAEQAWERLSEPNANERSKFAVVPASQTNTYHVWTRPYPIGQSIETYGFVWVRQPLDPADPVLVSLNDYLVSGVESLAGLTTATNIHAWGQFIPDENGNLVFHLERWESSPIVEEYYEGTIQRMDTLGLLVTGDSVMILPDLPQDVPNGLQVFATGLLQGGQPAILDSATLDWFHITGGNYPNSYYTSQSCGGGGGGGGGGAENVNFGAGSFALPNLDQLPTSTPGSESVNVGEIISGTTGHIYVTIHLYADGSSIPEINIITGPTGEAPFGGYYRLEGAATARLEQYQSLPVRIWGQVTGDSEGTPIITVERYEAQFPGLQIQQWNGTEAIVSLEGQDVVLLTASSGESYVLQSSLTWGAEGNIVGVLGELIEIEGYIIPDRQFGGYPVIQDLGGGSPPDGEVTSDDTFYYDHSLDAPDVTTLMAGQVTIDSIELAYASITMENCLSSHNTDPNMIPFLTVQPVWVFSGHFDDGRVIVIQVQALPEEYLQ